MITRRVAQRMFLLRPEKTINEVFEYCLAEAARKHDIVLIAWTVMSNHYHAVIHDPHGVLPAFIARLNRLVAVCLNVHHGRWENVWSSDATCCTRLVTPADVIDKVVYVLLNPVSAGLVDSATQWPGATSWPLMGRSPLPRRRPSVFFKKSSRKMPESVSLQADVPPGVDGIAAAAWISHVRSLVAAGEAALAQKRRMNGTKLLGRKMVRATSPFDTPSTETRVRKLNPSLACREKVRMIEARELLRTFWSRYREVLEEFRSGNRNVKFPAGTYRMRQLGASCIVSEGHAA